MALRKSKRVKVDRLASPDPSVAEVITPDERHPSLSVFPLEILFEIFSYVDAVDLLSVARSNRWLWSTLAGRQASSLWKITMKPYEDLPECPSNMCGARYTSLMFEVHCENCDDEGPAQIIWNDRLRICSRCRESSYSKSKPRPPKGFNEDEWERIMNAVVTTSLLQSSHSYRVNNKGWYKPIINSLREILPALSPDEQKAHINQVLKRRWKTEKWNGWEYHRWTADRLFWAQQKKAAEEAAIKKQRKKEHAQIKSRRTSQIIDRLVKAGFKKQLAIPDVRRTFIRHKTFQIPQELAESEWPEIESLLSDRIGQIMTNNDEHKGKDVLIGRFTAFVSVLDKMSEELPDIHPHRYIDLILMPQVREVLDLPPNKKVTSAAMVRLRKSLPSLWAQWKRDIEDSIARQHHILLPIFEMLGTLDHPAAQFTCRFCYSKEILTYNELFSHNCHGKDYQPKKSDGQTSAMNGSVYEYAARIVCKRTEWVEFLHVGCAAQRTIEAMRACKVEPESSTWEDMDNLDAALVCSICQARGLGVIMDWRTAMAHGSQHHLFEDIEWSLATNLDWPVSSTDPELTRQWGSQELEEQDSNAECFVDYSPLLR